MIDILPIRTQRTTASRLTELDPSKLEFGKVFSDHMFAVDYHDGEWQEAQIVPYGDMAVSPANSALHYGQAIFEGMKAYHQVDGGVALFRPFDNWARLNTSAERMVIHLSEESFVAALVIMYLNRLSDYLFVLSRYMAHELGVEEVTWKARL